MISVTEVDLKSKDVLSIQRLPGANLFFQWSLNICWAANGLLQFRIAVMTSTHTRCLALFNQPLDCIPSLAQCCLG